jgi:phosphoribosylformylglycinamidine synthase
MPHPERCFRAVQNSWYPEDWKTDAGWMRFFRNARVWVGGILLYWGGLLVAS